MSESRLEVELAPPAFNNRSGMQRRERQVHAPVRERVDVTKFPVDQESDTGARGYARLKRERAGASHRDQARPLSHVWQRKTPFRQRIE